MQVNPFSESMFIPAYCREEKVRKNMKKLIVIVMVLMLVCCTAALAEGGMETQNGMVQYVSEAGYSLWYNPALLNVQSDAINDCFYPAGSDGDSEIAMLVVPVDIEPEYAEDLIYEATGGYGEECAVSEISRVVLQSGINVSTVEARYGNTVDRYYLVTDESNVLCITVTFPAETEAEWGLCFEAMVAGIAF